MEISKVDRAKWFVRTGALLLLIGFILPSVLVSCAGAPGYGRSLSLYDISSLVNAPLLYLVPLGALVVLILAFLPKYILTSFPAVFWGQVGGAVTGLAGILLPLISLSGQLQDIGFQITPQAGMLVLVGGFVLIAIGLAQEWGEMRDQPGEWRGVIPKANSTYYSPTPPPSMGVQADPPMRSLPAIPVYDSNQVPASHELREHLRVVRGNLPKRIIPLTHDGFTVGRDPGSDLHLPELDVSRRHARLRFGQGSWFIQDTDSACGIRVNGKSVLAHRLEDGDEVNIGEYVFRFCQPTPTDRLKDEE